MNTHAKPASSAPGPTTTSQVSEARNQSGLRQGFTLWRSYFALRMEKHGGVAPWKLLKDQLMIFHPALIVLKESSCLLIRATALCLHELLHFANHSSGFRHAFYTFIGTKVNKHTKQPIDISSKQCFSRELILVPQPGTNSTGTIWKPTHPLASMSTAETICTPGNRTPITIASWLSIPHLTCSAHDGWILSYLALYQKQILKIPSPAYHTIYWAVFLMIIFIVPTFAACKKLPLSLVYNVTFSNICELKVRRGRRILYSGKEISLQVYKAYTNLLEMSLHLILRQSMSLCCLIKPCLR